MLTSGLPVREKIPSDVQNAWERARERLALFAPEPYYFATLPSTNDLAMRLVDAGAAEGTTLLANAQTAGRGRRGREWFSPPGSGIYVSVILRPALSKLGALASAPHHAASFPTASWITSRVTLTAGVALAEGVRASTGLPVELKWPNDLLIHRRKVAGILAELATTATDHPAVVLGMGINACTGSFPSELAASATSIESELGRPIDRTLVLVETLAALASRYEDLRSGRFNVILAAWRAMAPSLVGAPIEWDTAEGAVQGHAMDVDSDGALLARAHGTITRIVGGEVRWR